MFQSIRYTNEKWKKGDPYHYQLEDSDFISTGMILIGDATGFPYAQIVVKEYSERNLNVAANLIKLMVWIRDRGGSTLAEQVKYMEYCQPAFFTPELKLQLQKYLIIV